MQNDERGGGLGWLGGLAVAGGSFGLGAYAAARAAGKVTQGRAMREAVLPTAAPAPVAHAAPPPAAMANPAAHVAPPPPSASAVPPPVIQTPDLRNGLPARTTSVHERAPELAAAAAKPEASLASQLAEVNQSFAVANPELYRKVRQSAGNLTPEEITKVTQLKEARTQVLNEYGQKRLSDPNAQADFAQQFASMSSGLQSKGNVGNLANSFGVGEVRKAADFELSRLLKGVFGSNSSKLKQAEGEIYKLLELTLDPRHLGVSPIAMAKLQSNPIMQRRPANGAIDQFLGQISHALTEQLAAKSPV